MKISIGLIMRSARPENRPIAGRQNPVSIINQGQFGCHAGTIPSHFRFMLGWSAHARRAAEDSVPAIPTYADSQILLKPPARRLGFVSGYWKSETTNVVERSDNYED